MQPANRAHPLLNIPPAAILLDTTLRDGEQAPGVALSPDEKAEYVTMAEDAGIRYIEVGFPQNPLDVEACRAAARASRTARVVMMALTTRASTGLASDAGAHEVLFVVPASEAHLKHVFSGPYEALRDSMLDAVDAARALGMAVNVGLEDASHGDFELIFRILSDLALIGSSVDCVTIPDTRGQLLPAEVQALLAAVRPRLPSQNCRLAFHAHNDLGLATANSVAALQSNPPVDCIHVTACGFGERAGNASLEQMAAVMTSKLELDPGIHLEALSQLCAFVEQVFWTPIGPHAPVVGAKVFMHESGLHQKAMLQDGRSFEYLNPARFGRCSELVLGKHSGHHLRDRIAGDAGCDEGDVMAYQQAIAAARHRRRASLRNTLDSILRMGFMGASPRDVSQALHQASRSGPYLEGKDAE